MTAALELAKDPQDVELAELRAKRQAIANKRREREQKNATSEQIALEKQGLIDDEALEAAELEFGPVGKKIGVVKTDLGNIILKRAHPHIFKRYQDKGSIKTEDLERLVRPSLLHPDAAKFDSILEDLPATLMRCADAIAVLAGVRTEELQAK